MKCYIKPPTKYDLPDEIMDKSITLFYPEAGMTQNQLFRTAKPKDFHVVTDSPFIVPLYDRYEVFICVRGKWVNPEIQTYGADYSRIMTLWKDYFPVPAYCLNGKVNNCLGSKLTYK